MHRRALRWLLWFGLFFLAVECFNAFRSYARWNSIRSGTKRSIMEESVRRKGYGADYTEFDSQRGGQIVFTDDRLFTSLKVDVSIGKDLRVWEIRRELCICGLGPIRTKDPP
jgi:hypothetical protein